MEALPAIIGVIGVWCIIGFAASFFWFILTDSDRAERLMFVFPLIIGVMGVIVAIGGALAFTYCVFAGCSLV